MVAPSETVAVEKVGGWFTTETEADLTDLKDETCFLKFLPSS